MLGASGEEFDAQCFGLSFEGLQSSADVTVAAAFNAPKLQVLFSINREKSCL